MCGATYPDYAGLRFPLDLGETSKFPHTNHIQTTKSHHSVSSHTLVPTSICDLSHSVCRSPLTDLGHISSVTYICHPLWFVCGHRKGILTSPLMHPSTVSCKERLEMLVKLQHWSPWGQNDNFTAILSILVKCTNSKREKVSKVKKDYIYFAK